MPLRIVIQGSEYPLDDETKNIMEYFIEADALQAIQTNLPFQINLIDKKNWEQIIRLCKLVNNKFPQIAKVKTSDPRQVIGNELADALSSKSPEEINELYRAAHFLKIKNLRRSIAAVLACKVYIKPSLDDYNKKKAQLNITKELTAQDSRMMKETYTFMN